MSYIGNLIADRFLKPAHDMKVSQFAEFTPAAGGVAFLGDSITAAGQWHEWFPGIHAVNRGIDGDTAEGLLARLDVAIVGPPSKVFLLIGTNDLSRHVPPMDIVDRVAKIIDRVRTVAPEASVVVQSVMPRDRKFRDRVRALNERYENLARSRGATYLDLWPFLAAADGTLRAEFTLDTLHLTGAGYRAWAGALRDLALE